MAKRKQRLNSFVIEPTITDLHAFVVNRPAVDARAEESLRHATGLREEAEHLLFVRKVVQKFALSETTGQPQKMPKSSGVVETLLK